LPLVPPQDSGYLGVEPLRIRTNGSRLSCFSNNTSSNPTPLRPVPRDVALDIQGFTQGIVGDINAICCAALDAIAARSTGSNRQPKITRALLKEAGTHLNLRYDASGWSRPVEEDLSPEAVHLKDPSRLRLEAARLIVSSGKTVVAEVTLNRPRMVLGRDESCDISLDSRYVSRFQNLFLETLEGWMLIDLSSTNGCFVNGRRIREHRL
jgi:hypothetical protein